MVITFFCGNYRVRSKMFEKEKVLPEKMLARKVNKMSLPRIICPEGVWVGNTKYSATFLSNLWKCKTCLTDILFFF